MASSAAPRGSLLRIVQRVDAFVLDGRTTAPLVVDGCVVGYVKSDVLAEIKQNHADVLRVDADKHEVSFAGSVAATFEARSGALEGVVTRWRAQGLFPAALKGWRNEKSPIPAQGNLLSSDPLLFELERSAVGLFGLPGFGVHLNGYVRRSNGAAIHMWIARRSLRKQTYPGMLDNIVAGGMPTGMSIPDNLAKECEEEAGMSPALARTARPVGAINYIHENDRGIHPETQFIYDIELPEDFVPVPQDGEVEEFMLLPIPEVIDRLGEFKPNCAVIVVHFLIRHGLVTPDTEPDYLAIVKAMNRRQ